jgi:hypothetical protein
MKTFLKAAALAAITASAIAGSANAAITITNTVGDVTPAGFLIVADFDNALGVGYSLTGADIRTASSGDAAQPPGDETAFLNITGGHSTTLTSVDGFKGFSFYMGSPDSYNCISIDGGPAIYGAAMFGSPAQSADGNQGVGFTVKYDLGDTVAHSVTFGSDSNSFELDNVATAAVPEPATWALMISGFGMAGMALRQRRRVFA